MKKALLELLEIRSIVAIIITITFVFMVITGRIVNDDFISVFSVIITFYFGKRVGEYNKGNEEDCEEYDDE